MTWVLVIGGVWLAVAVVVALVVARAIRGVEALDRSDERAGTTLPDSLELTSTWLLLPACDGSPGVGPAERGAATSPTAPEPRSPGDGERQDGAHEDVR